MLLYLLSVDSGLHAAYRCKQRAFFAAMGVSEGSASRIDAWRSLELRYLLDDRPPSPQLVVELAAHRDLLRLRGAQTCLGKVIAAVRHLRAGPRFDAVVFSDDDAVVHPHRLTLDMFEHSWSDRLVYGSLAWGAGWNSRVHAHYGYGSMTRDLTVKLPGMWRSHARREGAEHTAQGPFPFPYGFCMGLGNGTVAALNTALDATPELASLQAALASKPPTPKCAPEPDSGLGYLLAVLQRTEPLDWVDVTSGARSAPRAADGGR